jgi:hypothetical protein
MKSGIQIGQQVFSLILGPDETGSSEAFASLLLTIDSLTIVKKIRSNTYCPISLMKNMDYKG